MYPDLMAACSDFVRLYKLNDNGSMSVECVLNNVSIANIAPASGKSLAVTL